MPIHEQTFELAETAIDFVKAAVEGVLGDALTIEQLKQHEQTMHDIALPTPVQVDRNRPSLDDMHRCMTLERHYNVVLRRVMFLQNKHLQNTLADLASRVNQIVTTVTPTPFLPMDTRHEFVHIRKMSINC